jgi:hypothetical protein
VVGEIVMLGVPGVIALMVPLASAPPPTSTTVSPTTIELKSVVLVRVRVAEEKGMPE